jgi:hypothetical protein
MLRRDQPSPQTDADTLNRLLPFKLRLTLAPIAPSKGRRAALILGDQCIKHISR